MILEIGGRAKELVVIHDGGRPLVDLDTIIFNSTKDEHITCNVKAKR